MSMTETVTVRGRLESGIDEYGEPTYETIVAIVDGVLVKQLEGDELDGAERPNGMKVEYCIAFPGSFDLKSLEGAEVVLTGRGDNRPLKVVQIVNVPQSPLMWKSRVWVGRTDG